MNEQDKEAIRKANAIIAKYDETTHKHRFSDAYDYEFPQWNEDEKKRRQTCRCGKVRWVRRKTKWSRTK